MPKEHAYVTTILDDKRVLVLESQITPIDGGASFSPTTHLYVFDAKGGLHEQLLYMQGYGGDKINTRPKRRAFAFEEPGCRIGYLPEDQLWTGYEPSTWLDESTGIAHDSYLKTQMLDAVEAANEAIAAHPEWEAKPVSYLAPEPEKLADAAQTGGPADGTWAGSIKKGDFGIGG